MTENQVPDAATDPASDPPFEAIADRVKAYARRHPTALAVSDARETLDYAAFDALVDRVAASLQRDGVAPGEAVATCAANSARYAAVFLGALRAGIALAPLSPSVTPDAFGAMLRDCGARVLFADAQVAALLGGPTADRPPLVALRDGAPGTPFEHWLAPAGSAPQRVEITPGMAFNIIYSSGTTGAPKGIVQSHGMRWTHVMRGAAAGYDAQAVTLLATPLYSNTTLVAFFPTLSNGGCVVLMDKFDAERYLELAQAHRATHTMLVPVQVQRLMACPDFDVFDLGAFRMKFCTSAPFAAALKADVLARWPGGLVEYYGMTEGESDN